jgi:hypothetical protein
LKLRLVSVDCTGIGAMNAGIGEMRIEFSADLPRANCSHRRLIENQSFYQVDYVQADSRADVPFRWRLGGKASAFGAVVLLLSAVLVLLSTRAY